MSDGQYRTENSDAKSKPLNILFFHNTLPEYRIGWFENLDKRANIEFIFTNEKQNEKDYGFKIDYEKVKELKCTFLSKGKQGFQELQRLMVDVEKYDFVELPPIDSIREVIYSTYIIYKCKQKKIKIGYFWEKWDAPLEKQPLVRRIKNAILRIFPGMLYKQADVIFSTGTKNKAYFISNGVSESKIAWIPDVSETPKCKYINLREKYQIPAERKIILYLGRMIPQKGVKSLIEAYASLDFEEKNNSHLLIAGDGEDLENCKVLSNKLKIDNINFVGSVNPSVRGNYFSQCDIFVYPVTYYRGRVDVWGLTVNEAIQHGKIVIATDAVGSAYELIENGVNGYRVEPGNSRVLCDAIKKAAMLVGTECARKKDNMLMRYYCFENMAETYINCVVKVCKRRDEWQN